jgi:hypothetical protein
MVFTHVEIPQGQTMFFLDRRRKITFLTDNKGRSTGLILHQGRKTIQGKRIGDGPCTVRMREQG